MTGGSWLLLLTALAGIALAVLRWYWGPKRSQKKIRKERDKAHAANAAKDGKTLGEYFRDRHRNP